MLLATGGDNAVNLPLFLHVFGAMLLTGTLFTVVLTSFIGWRRSDAAGLQRLGYRAMLLGVFPAYLIMRIGAQWTEVEMGLDKVSEDEGMLWIGIGYITADIGALLILISMICSGVGLRKLRNGKGHKLNRAIGIMSLILLVALLVTVWAMTTKPA